MLTYSSTENFGPAIPLSHLLIFYRRDLILHQKRKWKLKNTNNFMMKKNKNKTKKTPKSILYSEFTPLTRDVTCFKL